MNITLSKYYKSCKEHTQKIKENILPLFISLSLYLKVVSEYKGAAEPIFQHIVEEQCLK
jgi:hypothetical protein